MNSLSIAFIVLGYLLGSIPFGLLLTQSAGLGDVRKIGSGSIGATNVLRTGNKKLAAMTLLLDAAKGAAAVMLARGAAGTDAGLWAALGAVIGHLFPIWLKFKGGKGVATAYGVMFAAAWPVGLGSGVIWLAMAAIGRRSSLSSLTAIAAMPVIAYFSRPMAIVYLSLTIAVLVWWRHHENIARLLAGTEPKIGQGK